MAMRRMPPDFFWRAISFHPKNIGVTDGGHLPFIKKFTSAVKEVVSVGPVTLFVVKSRRC
jgi:hypothetical protein